MTRQYCHIGTRTIAYLDSAPGDTMRRIYVLLHAFPIGANLWEPQMHGIPDGWRLITPDLRGFGGSTDVDSRGGESMSDYADDLVEFFNELGIQRAVVGGCSMGGYATFAFLQRAADRVDGVILANTRAGSDSPEARANRRNMLAVLNREGPAGVARDMMPKLLGKTTHESNPEAEPTVRRLIKQQSPDAIRAAIHRMMHRPDSTPLLAQINVPTLVITGDEDELIPIDESRAIANAVHGATLTIIPKAGHLSNLEQPDPFNNALTAFLTKL